MLAPARHTATHRRQGAGSSALQVLQAPGRCPLRSERRAVGDTMGHAKQQGQPKALSFGPFGALVALIHERVKAPEAISG